MRAGSLEPPAAGFRRSAQSAGRWDLRGPGVVAVDVVGVLQDISGEDRHHIGVAAHDSRRDQLADSRQGGGGGRLAADAAPANHRLGVGDFLFRDLLHHAFGTVTSCSAFGQETGSPMRMAVASVWGCSTGRNGSGRRRASDRRKARILRLEPPPGAAGGRSGPASSSRAAPCRRRRYCPGCRPATPPIRAAASRAGPSSPP